MGVVAQSTFDPLGGCLFIVCIFIEGGIFVSHGIWLLRTRKLRAAAKAAGRDFDELPESDVYHVEARRKGSIAASRDVERDEIARRGSIAVARDLELGEGSMMTVLQTVKDCSSEELSPKADVDVKQELAGSSEGVHGIDYGTMAAAPKTRPGFKRQDTSTASTAYFKDPKW